MTGCLVFQSGLLLRLVSDIEDKDNEDNDNKDKNNEDKDNVHSACDSGWFETSLGSGSTMHYNAFHI